MVQKTLQATFPHRLSALYETVSALEWRCRRRCANKRNRATCYAAGSCLPLFGRFLGTTTSSDFSLAYMLGETPTHWIVMGLNPNLEEAMKMAVRETILFITRVPQRHMTGGAMT
jgi:hypothetical protein